MFRVIPVFLALVILLYYKVSDFPFLQEQRLNLSYSDSNKNLLYKECFEDSSSFIGLQHQFAATHAFRLATSPVFEGAMSGRFELRASDPMVSNGTRSEVLFDVPAHKERWYAFVAYFPADGFPVDSNNDIINQWHQKGSPATSFRIKKDRFMLRVGNSHDSREDIDLGPVTKDIWHKLVFHIIHSDGEDGLVEVWLDGTKVLTHKGGNMYPGRLPRWKVGIYKDNWNGDRKTDSDLRIYYIDDIKVGNEHASLNDLL